MRFLHTADWHLGRLFHGRSLLEDQAHLLNQFVELVGSERPDAVLIAGDVYDRAVPPAEAVNLLDDTLSRIVLGLQVPVVMIAGNHDSADRLGFGARLLAAGGLHIAGRPGEAGEGLRLRDAWGEVCIQALPYAEPALVRDLLGQVVADHDAAIAAMLGWMRERGGWGERNVLVAHAFVAGGTESESERPLSVGGSGAVPVSHFERFDYVALGHLHRAQQVGSARVQYAGSLMKYSLSEAGHAKSVTRVELGAPGAGLLSCERLSLSPMRDLRCLRGTLAGLVEAGRQDAARDDYVFAQLTDDGALLEPMARLREVYPNILGCEREVLARSGAGGAAALRRQFDMRTLFGEFHREVVGETLDEAALQALDQVLEAMAQDAREAGRAEA